MLLCAIPFASLLFSACAPPLPLATGYVEGEYILIAPLQTAEIDEISVARGDRVKAGAPLAAMDLRDAEIALVEAEAAVAKAASQLANLREGKRPEEILVIEAALASAAAQRAEAARAEARIASLSDRGAASAAAREDAATAAQVAAAREAEIAANLAVARLPARAEEIAAAEASLRGAEAGRDRARWQLDRRRLTAPVAGVITDILRHPGEIAGPTQPVLSLLPDGGVKLRLYLPQEGLAAVRPGTELAVGCDGCAPGLVATVTWVSDEPEFTPPVIYSLENRQKLVFQLEAVPVPGSGLVPGQIVDVRLPGSAP